MRDSLKSLFRPPERLNCSDGKSKISEDPKNRKAAFLEAASQGRAETFSLQMVNVLTPSTLTLVDEYSKLTSRIVNPRPLPVQYRAQLMAVSWLALPHDKSPSRHL